MEKLPSELLGNVAGDVTDVSVDKNRFESAGEFIQRNKLYVGVGVVIIALVIWYYYYRFPNKQQPARPNSQAVYPLKDTVTPVSVEGGAPKGVPQRGSQEPPWGTTNSMNVSQDASTTKSMNVMDSFESNKRRSKSKTKRVDPNGTIQ